MDAKEALRSGRAHGGGCRLRDRPVGILAMDMAVEAGLFMIEVDYTSTTSCLDRAAKIDAVRAGHRLDGGAR